ncbi:ABC transporter ATP-binding protein [bacterium]|nr:MAG: ABC transporter ATP-binding protein [bacterium]
MGFTRFLRIRLQSLWHLPIPLTMGVPAIRVVDLRVDYRTKRHETVHAVLGLSFTVQPGEIVGFLGPNGAGKSSTLKTLMGFVAPVSGEASIFGLSAGCAPARAHVGYLPEVAMYYPFLTPIETLRLYGELQGLSGRSLAREIEDLLERVGIGASARKLNRSLSKGMLQRVGIAQALLGSPDLLILDEVTSGLDPVGRRELRDLLKERQRQGATLFFSSHELAEVDLLCDRILLVNKGILIDEREMAPLKSELQRFALVYSGAVGLVDLAETLSPDGDYARATFDRRERLVAAIERITSAGGTIHDVTSAEGSLEDYFIGKIAPEGVESREATAKREVAA